MVEATGYSPKDNHAKDSAEGVEEKYVQKAEKKYPSTPPIPEKLIAEYYQNKDLIANLYRNVDYWHGTGRKRYRNGKTVDTLDGIIGASGFAPETDKFDFKHGDMNTTSVANRMYASLYAKMNLTDGENLGYEYYPREFWSKIFIGVTNKYAGKEIFSEGLKHIIPMAKFYPNLKAWFRKVRSNASFLSKVYSIRSDIPGNYPILFGIKKDAISPAQTASYISKYEIRTSQPIPLSGITHIEVPVTQVANTKKFLEKRGVGDLPVIAMEYGEIYSSQFTPRQHITGNPFRNLPL